MACDGFLRVYVDNVLKGTTAYDNTVKDVAQLFEVGRGSAANGFFMDGGEDEMGFWKNITFAGQTEREAFVAALYNSGAGRFYAKGSYLTRNVSGVLDRTAAAVLERIST